MSREFNNNGGVLETYGFQPQELEIDTDNRIMMHLHWNDTEGKIQTIEEFLDLTEIEKKEIETMYKPLGFTLVGDKRIGGEYPDYFKNFHERYIRYFAGSQEITRQRDQFKEDTSNEMFPDREKRELIFVKLNFPENISPVIKKETLSFKKVFESILANMVHPK